MPERPTERTKDPRIEDDHDREDRAQGRQEDAGGPPRG